MVDGVIAALEAAGQVVARPATAPDVRGIAADSRAVEPGFLFCAIPGSSDDGHRYVPDAIGRGAVLLIVSRAVTAAVPQIVVRDARAAAAIAAAQWYGEPARALRIIGVTGTNGKSTTVAIIRHLLNADASAGTIGTLGATDGRGAALPGAGTLTTPGPIELHAVLDALRRRGVRTVVMEASSHALDQQRLATLALAGAVYTNLTQDHLDYHGDLERYRQAKLRLSALLAPNGVEVVNADDPAWQPLGPRDGVRHVRYGTQATADVQVVTAAVGSDGSHVRLRLGRASVEAAIPLLGSFNVTNALAGAATAWALGVSPDDIATRLGHVPQVPGRMERLVAGDAPFLVLRDYAHTPDALERAIAAARPLTPGRLIVLFGAGGDRDRAKRPLMGRIAVRGADLAVVTSDNPRTEDPDAIIREIEAGMEGAHYLRIVDREAAIHEVVRMLQPGDCLLLAGKGHETYQVVGTERRPFDEWLIVRSALAARSAA